MQPICLNPFVGTPLGEGVRKVRMTISSKGKSGGARVLTYSVNKESDDEIKVTLMSIYDKSRISKTLFSEYNCGCSKHNKCRINNRTHCADV